MVSTSLYDDQRFIAGVSTHNICFDGSIKVEYLMISLPRLVFHWISLPLNTYTTVCPRLFNSSLHVGGQHWFFVDTSGEVAVAY
jgi:hypothetical protein